MKTTLDLPDDLIREARIRAAREGKKLKDIMEQAIRIGFGNPSSSRPPLPSFLKISPEGFPYIECGPNAQKLTAEDYIKIEQDAILEEDLQRVRIIP